MFHFGEHGEGDFGRQVHQNQVWGALTKLFQEGCHRAAGRQQLEALDLPQYRLQAFRQNGFIAIKKNPRHILHLYKQPVQILAIFPANNLEIVPAFRWLFSSALSIYLLRLSRINYRNYHLNIRY
jgi:hypothetical protein